MNCNTFIKWIRIWCSWECGRSKCYSYQGNGNDLIELLKFTITSRLMWFMWSNINIRNTQLTHSRHPHVWQQAALQVSIDNIRVYANSINNISPTSAIHEHQKHNGTRINIYRECSSIIVNNYFGSVLYWHPLTFVKLVTLGSQYLLLSWELVLGLKEK